MLRSCPEGYLFSPKWKLCIHPPQACHLESDLCSPENATIWESCDMKSGCRLPSIEQIGELLCQEYSCSDRNGFQPCGPGTLFNPYSKSCVAELTPCPPEVPCTANTAQHWGRCNTVSGCTLDGQEVLMVRQCQHYSCSITGPEFKCEGGQVFNPESKVCTNPVSDNDLCDPDPTTPLPPSTSCTTVESSCQDYEVCDPTSRKLRLCQREQCTRDGQYLGERNMCFDQGELYDLETKRCVRTPTDNDLCDSDPTTTPTPSTSCTTVESSCQDYEVCDPTSRKLRLCQREQCIRDGQNLGESNMCFVQGELYDLETRRCVRPPTDNDLCDSDPTTTPTPSTSCTTVESSCQDYEVCDSTSRKLRLCQREQCTRDGQNLGESNMCFVQGELYDLETRRCVRPPTDNNCPCTVDRAKFWGDCTDVTGCTADDQIERTEKQCKLFSCSITGEEIGCENGQVFSPDQKACVEPLNGNIAHILGI
ncbi:unnamed protein product [Meganyctiphanes norvegica]|uniref:Uncharacterized protein n=1 Tax=Meganyctiphanes norvegica TaxID=48144 RepID=A0AAV2RT27_MEGNR